ncbi:hypothetical protein GCM10023196_003470 [Actinoallomurus vinaceus]|uniref:Uncharacterized protein n=1 Tax=Actinoallomurus vinaceus TaxID=1080074 RepID=A0ABP8U3P9_9ACTN
MQYSGTQIDDDPVVVLRFFNRLGPGPGGTGTAHAPAETPRLDPRPTATPVIPATPATLLTEEPGPTS